MVWYGSDNNKITALPNGYAHTHGNTCLIAAIGIIVLAVEK